MAKKDEPIKTYEEYQRRLKKVKTARVLVILIPSIIIFILCAILFSNGKVLKIFGVKNYYAVIQFFYGAFYVITAIVIVVIIAVAIFLLIKLLIAYIKDKNSR